MSSIKNNQMYKTKLSPYHKIFYNEWKLDSLSSKYNIVFDQIISSNLDIPRLKDALHRFVSEHLIINSHVEEMNGEFYWRPNSQIADLEYFVGVCTQEQIFKYASKSFDIESGALYRFAVFEEPDGSYRLILIFHHLLIDGNSFNEFVLKISDYYNDNAYKTSTIIKEQAHILNATTVMLYEQLDTQSETYRTFWDNILTNIEAVDLRFIQPRIQAQSNSSCQIKEIQFQFVNNTIGMLSQLKRKYDINSYQYGFAVFAILLNRYTSQSRFGISFPVLIKEHTGLFSGAGVNTSIFPCHFEPDTTMIDLVTKFQEFLHSIKTNKYGYYPINNIIENANSHILDVFFAMTNLKNRRFSFNNAQSLKINEDLNADSPARLLFEQSLDNGILLYRVKFNNTLVDEQILEQFISHYKVLFTEILSDLLLNNLTKPIYSYNILTPGEYQRIVYDWNQTKQDYPNDKLIHQLFEEQVLRTPENIAIVYENIQLTYNELNIKANQLAHYIRDNYNIKPDDLIALYLDRSAYMMIAILGVLKSGGAYVPIDINCPTIRIVSILEEIKALLIVTDTNNQDKLAKTVNKLNIAVTNQLPIIIAIDSTNIQSKYKGMIFENPGNIVTASNLAYVMYTSGTTGNPKGIMIEHKSVVNTIISLYGIYDLKLGHRATAFTSYVFDVSLSEFFVILFRGGELHLFSEDTKRDADAVSAYLLHNKINYTYLPPALLATLPQKSYPALVGIIYAGEACDKATGTYWSNNYKLFNYYGPTETSIYALGKQVINGDVEQIGIPINNLRAYVLDTALNPLPVGVIGELYIGGAGVARGYFNNPELTAKIFITNPFQTEEEMKCNENNKLYKTGDLVRMLPNGNLEYIGRNDSQIKVRGFRIELSEIENAINNYPGVQKSIVLALESPNHNSNLTGNKYLFAYYTISTNINNKDQDRYVDSWENIYNLQYANLNKNSYKENMDGWKSSYTGEAIPKEYMLEWLNETISRVSSLTPERILEIGSGSGLLLFNLVDNCKYYYATDFSSSSVKYTKQMIKDLRYENKVTALKCRADQLPFHKMGMTYDTVLLNSVVQYFPNLDYMEDVLHQLIANIDPIGQIFIGDVRDYRLLEYFYYSILKYKNNNVTLSEINYFIRKEKELLISPEYFVNFQKKNIHISHVEFLPKLGEASHEMNCYRYDVILHINKSNQKQYSHKNIPATDFIKIPDVKKYLTNHIKNKYIYIKYPNKRIVKDYIECGQLRGKQCDFSIDDIDTLLSLTELSHTFAQEDFKLDFYLDIFDPLYINIIGCQDGHAEKHIIDYNVETIFGEVANNPAYNIVKLQDNEFSGKLKKHLKNILPNYMIPEYLMAIDKFPLNASGKVDKRLLPNPEFIINSSYIPPQNQLESQICEIIANILGLPEFKISRNDSFFDLGGNSILAIKLVSKLNDSLACKLKVAHIFVNKTVEKIALLVEEFKKRSDLVVNLTNIKNKNNLFMIHPAFAGAEVYTDLAQTLSGEYNCYGIDNYNLHNKNKIDNLNQLADFYLSVIDEVRHNIEQEGQPYLLLGWSLGGQIALEIASILEQRGCKDIRIILIDSILPDNKITKYFSALEVHQSMLYKDYIKKGYLKEYVDNVISNFCYDIKLSQQNPKTWLKHTQIILFKALGLDGRKIFTNYTQVNKYIISLDYNNIDTITSLNHIKLVGLKEESHSTVINQVKLIHDNINLWHYELNKKRDLAGHLPDTNTGYSVYGNQNKIGENLTKPDKKESRNKKDNVQLKMTTN